ncbi:MAG: DUF4417 domain-containing protein [Victivallales bacterium]|nr:DUF4417 domain-containing protein [Victivallales bacterium]
MDTANVSTQFVFDFLNGSLAKDCPRKSRAKKVHPTDITDFLDKHLPEFKDGILDGTLSEGPFHLPCLAPVQDAKPEALVPFNAVMSMDKKEINAFSFFHFFVDDYQFERFWRNPPFYLPFLMKIGQGMGTDYSMYHYMHPVEALVNCTRNRLMAFYLQKKGLKVIPNACFGNLETLDWAFDGLPEHSVLAMNTQGCLTDYQVKQTLLNGIHRLVRRKHPKLLYIYGEFPEDWTDKFGVEIVTLSTFLAKWK